MSQNQTITEPHQAITNHSSVIEFASVLATLHNSDSSNQSRTPTPASTPLPSVPRPSRMATSLKDLIPYFSGRDVNDEGGQEDPAEYIENLNFAVDGQTYTDEDRKLTATRVIFRTHLRDKALLWYHSLSPRRERVGRNSKPLSSPGSP